MPMVHNITHLFIIYLLCAIYYTFPNLLTLRINSQCLHLVLYIIKTLNFTGVYLNTENIYAHARVITL